MGRTAYVNDLDAKFPFLGHTVIGKTAYRVYRLNANPESGIVARFGLVGPKGSTYMVTDHGPRYLLNSVCIGGGVSWQAAPRPLRGLTREHLSLFTAQEPHAVTHAS